MRLPNGYGNISKLSGNRRNPYRVRILKGYKDNDATHKSSPVYETVGYFATRKEALAALAERHAHPVDVDVRKTLLQVFNDWVKTKEGKVGKGAYGQYKTCINYFKALHNKPFAELRTIDYEKCVPEIPRTMRSPAKSTLRQVYRYAMRYELVEKNYAELVNFDCDNTAQIVRRRYTPQEIAKLQAMRGYPLADMILFGIYTGFRPQEICTLPLDALHLDTDTPYIRHGIKTKNGKNRLVPIHPYILPIVKEYALKSVNLGVKTLFTTSIHAYGRHLRELAQALGYEHTPHDTRHTFATCASLCGMSALAVKLIMGHAVSDLTERVYTHYDEKVLYEEMLKYDPVTCL